MSSDRILSGHIYVVLFDSGILKVGKTSSPETRLAALSREARSQRASVRETWVSPRHGNHSANERLLIRWCSSRGESILAEYFVGVGFPEAVAYANGLTWEAPETDRRDLQGRPESRWVEEHPLTCSSLIYEVLRGDLILLDSATGRPIDPRDGYRANGA